MQYNLAENEQFLIKRGETTVEIPLDKSGTLGMGKQIKDPETSISGDVATVSCSDDSINSISLTETPTISTVELAFPPIATDGMPRNFYVSVIVADSSPDVSIVTPPDVEIKDFNGNAVVLTAETGKQMTFHFVEIQKSTVSAPAVFAVEGMQEPTPGPVVDPVLVNLPFFMRRTTEGSSQYIIYLPNKCLKYGSEYPSFVNVEHYDGNWYTITGVGTIAGNIWCIVYKNGEVVNAEFIQEATDAPPSRVDLLTCFKVAKVNPSAGQGLYDGITQVAGGQASLLPDALTDIIKDDIRIPFLVYPDKGGYNEQEQGAFMYLPAGSLTIDGQEVEFDGSEDGYFPVEEDTTYWCEIFRVVGKGIDDDSDSSSDSDSSDSEFSDLGEEQGIRYIARMSSEVVPDKDAVLRFKVTTVKKGVDCDQLVFGAVTLGPLPDYSQLVAWQVVQIDYEDSSAERKLYRMFVPYEGAISYNGFMLSIKEAQNGWYELEDDVGKSDSTKRYYCVIYKMAAHIFTEDEFNSFMAEHSDEQSNIQARFQVCEVKTGTGGGVEGESNTKKALIVTTENGYFAGAPHNRPGANADAKMWSSVFSGMTASENIMHLSDGQTDAETVSNALDLICDTTGLSIFMISTHGGLDGSMEIYNDILSPVTLAQKFAQSPGPVWFIADCCYSGLAIIDAKPMQSLAAKIVTEVGEYLRANAPGVPYLGWAATTTDEEGWCQEDGSVFTKSCYRNISAGISYADAWAAIAADPLVTSMQTPTKIVVNGFDEIMPIFGPTSEESEES